MTVRGRLIAGTAATATGPAVSALTQLIMVPALLTAWGPRLYGEWLVMSAIPSYLSLSDLGFGTVAGNEMAMAVACKDNARALEIFQSTWLLVSVLSVALFLLATAAIFVLPLGWWLHVTDATSTELNICLLALSAYSILTLQGSLLISGFRSDGKYALGTTASNVGRLFENVIVMVLGFKGYPPHVIATTYAIIRAISVLCLYAVLHRAVPWLRVGIDRASAHHVRRLLKPAVSFMGFPLGNAMSLQGMTILVNLTLGPVAVSVFSAMRALSRVAFQIIDTIKNSTWPELSTAFGTSNWALARRLHRTSCMAALWLSTIAVALLATFGPFIFKAWTRDRLTLDYPTFLILLLVVMAASLWNTSSAVQVAANLHSQLAFRYVIGTLASLILASLLVWYLALPGACLALLASDVWMACFVVYESNKILKENSASFFLSMLNAKTLFASNRP